MATPESATRSRLDKLEQLALEAGATTIGREARALAARVRDGRFYVACLGQFKRGKSTLLNALVGEPVLPVGVEPVTAVVTVIRHGDRRFARVRFLDGTSQEVEIEEIAAYVTEKENPGNSKGVAAVEVFLPSPLLSSGMCLVDTPGISSVFEGNTEVTKAFVPHIDAALVVLGADPPISADELALIGEISKQCNDVIFALNKADKLSEAEMARAEEFTRKVLKERLGLDGLSFFHVSAKERLAGRGPERGWPGLVGVLSDLALKSGSRLVQAAEARGLARLADRLRRHLEEQRGALLRPIEESERRAEALRACLKEAERALLDLDHLFAAEQARLYQVWEREYQSFLERAVPAAQSELAQAIRGLDVRRGPALRQKAIDLAHEISRRWLDEWRTQAEPRAEAMYVEAMQRFADLANNFLERLADTEPAMKGLVRAVEPESGFTYRSHLYYATLMTRTSQGPLGWLLDLLRPRKWELKAIEREVGHYLATLIDTNASRIIYDCEDRVIESRRRFQGRIRSAIAEACASAEMALARAKEYMAQGSQAVKLQVERINNLCERLAALGIQT